MGSKIIRNSVSALFVFMLALVFAAFLPSGAEAKTFTIRTPEQLRKINWKSEGYGPGHTYKIANGMTLGDGDDATCRLTKGKFVIDLNGQTVQNTHRSMAVFSVSGADVTFKSSKSSKEPNVRTYGLGCIDVQSGTARIQNGNYIGISDGSSNPCAISASGGTCIINGGTIYGDYVGASCGPGAKMFINGGSFGGGYQFALLNLGGNIKISKGTFSNPTSSYGQHIALGAYIGQSQSPYNFDSWLASGSSFADPFNTVYFNGNSQFYETPNASMFSMTPYAVSYTTSVKVKSRYSSMSGTSLQSLKKGKKSFTAKWKRQTKNSPGYQLQYSTASNFKGAKAVNISKNSTLSKAVKNLKSKKKYYVRIRTYKSINKTKYYSSWSKSKTVTTK